MTPPKPIEYPKEGNWRDVPGYEGLYQVSDRGQVWSLRRRRLLRSYSCLSRGGQRHYCVVDLKGTTNKTWMVHRLVAAAFLGWTADSGLWIDHINNDPRDNRSANLRLCTQSENLYNQKRRADSQSGYKGVRYEKSVGRWQARIRVNGKRFHLGMFATAEAAYDAYCEAAKKYHGEFARFE